MLDLLTTTDPLLLARFVYLYLLTAAMLVFIVVLSGTARLASRAIRLRVQDAQATLVWFLFGYVGLVIHGSISGFASELAAILGDACLVVAALFIFYVCASEPDAPRVGRKGRMAVFYFTALVVLFLAFERFGQTDYLRVSITVLMILMLLSLALFQQIRRWTSLDWGERVIFGSIVYLVLATIILPVAKRPGVSEHITISSMTLAQVPFLLGFASGTLLSVVTQLADKLNLRANQDWLTGLYNRRYLYDVYHRWLHRRRADDDGETYLLVFDIDDFKRINDQLGHGVGDNVLRAIAGTLVNIIRSSDIACRIGGEEFLVLMHDSNPDSAHRLAERIRSTIAETVPGACGLDLPVTVSLGIARANPEYSLEHTVSLADHSMYRAKALGKNRVYAAYPDRSPDTSASMSP